MTGQRPMSQDYENAKAIARDADANVRRDLAAREDIRPEILYYLAEDSDADVRATIAANQKTPGHADLLLARDPNDAVRCQLARKIGRLVPNISEAAQDRMRDLTLEILQILARDRLPDVRRMLAEELRATTQAPRDVIRKLARDREIEVAAPVLEFSPLLTDTDLLTLIATGPDKELVTAIARRDAVSKPVSDAIVETENVPAIATLLANPSAQIREETLDRLVTRAPAIPSWHAPLARRPELSPSMIRKLTGFLAASLLKTLQNRGDLDPETAAMVATAIHDRLQREEAGDLAPSEGNAQQNAASDVRALLEKGQLDEKAIAAAVGEGKHFFVTEALAALAHVPVKMAARILGAGNAAAVAALSWKASLGARLASRIQTRIAHVPPTEALSVETDTYPMDEAAMRLQLDSFQSATEMEIDAATGEPPSGGGLMEPDWATGETNPAQQVAEPDWATGDANPAQQVAEPDWATGETNPAQQVAEPDWATGDASLANEEEKEEAAKTPPAKTSGKTAPDA
ncbi:MAG: hypothetical protein COA65_06650 [Rhodospirillaceae bacterium]|nr:MAG: hypothetical protein COA65_06650 [Rhodospirillaceae bacterium]